MVRYGSNADTNIYELCYEANSASESDLLQCVANSLQQTGKTIGDGLDIFFMLYAAALVFFMQAGFAMLCAGCVRQKNVQNTMLKNLLDACSGAVAFYLVGFAFAYGDAIDDSESTGTTFIGNKKFFLSGADTDIFAFWLFQFAFAATSATIVAGTLAERCAMMGYFCYSLSLTGFIYPVIVHSIWSSRGFLSPNNANPMFGSGMIDFAGSGVVHVTGGITALIASSILGPRKGRFYDERTGELLVAPKKIPGHSTSLQVLGTFILWFGWYGFNPGSASKLSSDAGKVAAIAAVSTTLSAAVGGIASLAVSTYLTEKRTGEYTFDISSALNGCLSGLVAITAGCAVVEPWAAIIIGFVAGLLYLKSSTWLEYHRIDDAVDAIPVHFTNGVWGVLATGLFAKPEWVYLIYESDHAGWFYNLSDAKMLVCQVIGLAFIFAWVLCLMTPFFCWLNYIGWFRADPLEEVIGLDISYHGGQAYNYGEQPKLEFVNILRKDKPKGGDVTDDELENRPSYWGQAMEEEVMEAEGRITHNSSQADEPEHQPIYDGNFIPPHLQGPEDPESQRNEASSS